MPCRIWLTLYVFSVAFAALTTLAIANRVLMALEDERRAARAARAGQSELDFPAPPGFYLRQAVN